MNKIDFYASEIHYFDHIVPIWNKLPIKYKGVFYVSLEVLTKRQLLDRSDFQIGFPNDNLTLVASYKDYQKTKGKVIFGEHGIGHNYGNGHPAYVGGSGKERVVLFLNQHLLSNNTNKLAYPNAKNVIIGTPKMDNVKELEFRPNNRKPIVCISFHWDCMVCNNTRSAYYYYKNVIGQLAKCEEFTLIAHGHPRRNELELQAYGIKYYSDLNEVMEIADIYVNDNSSSMYEFINTGKPVIVLNCPLYDKHKDTGIRFWRYICGVQVDRPCDLKQAILNELANPEHYRELRDGIVNALYPYKGVATQSAVDVITEYLNAI